MLRRLLLVIVFEFLLTPGGLVPVGEVTVPAGVGVFGEGGGDVGVPLFDVVGVVVLVGVGSLSEMLDDVAGEAGVDAAGVGEGVVEAPVAVVFDRVGEEGAFGWCGGRVHGVVFGVDGVELLGAVHGGDGPVVADELVAGHRGDPPWHVEGGVAGGVGLEDTPDVNIPLITPFTGVGPVLPKLPQPARYNSPWWPALSGPWCRRVLAGHRSDP